MLTKIIYNCDPESLGSVDQVRFFNAFESIIHSKTGFQDITVEMTFKAGKSDVSYLHFDDMEIDLDREDEYQDFFRAIAHKAFNICCDVCV